MKKTAVFDVINNISYNKDQSKDISDYNPFIVNKAFSLYPDTILISNEMNINHHLSKKMQHDYMFNMIRKRKRWSQWPKKLNNDAIDTIARAYNCSIGKAIAINNLLSDQQRKQIKKRYNKGGVE